MYCSDRPIKKLTQFYKSNRWHYLLKKKFEITHLEPWFIRYFHVLPKSFVGYCTCKPIERVFFFPEILWILYLIIQGLWFWFDSQLYYKLMVKTIVNVILYSPVIRLSSAMNVLIGPKRKKEHFYDKLLRFVLFNLNDCNLMSIIHVSDCESQRTLKTKIISGIFLLFQGKCHQASD